MTFQRNRWPAWFAVLLLASCARQQSSSHLSSPGYPHMLTLGHSVYRVEREGEAVRPKLVLERTSENDGELEAVFRVTNPGDRAVLIWNVRQETLTDGSGATTSTWRTCESDYPGRGWERADVPPGGSAQFSIFSRCDGELRVCLLYSRESRAPNSPNRTFDGTFELIGPTIHEELSMVQVR